VSLWTATNGFNGVEVFNNTIYVDNTNLQGGATPQGLLFISSKLSNVHLRNNIFMVRNGLGIADFKGSQPGLIMQGNDYFSDGAPLQIKWGRTNYSTIGAWQNASGLEKVNNVSVALNVNPQFVNAGGGVIGDASAYQLQSSSPLINAGLNLIGMGLSPGTQDFFGDVLPTSSSQQFDVGAHEAVV